MTALSVAWAALVLAMAACTNSEEPEVFELQPAEAPSNQATAAAVLGRNFSSRASLALDSWVAVEMDTGWRISIDAVSLSEVQRVSAQRLEFVIPAGLSAGEHEVIVFGPGGLEFPLGRALTIEDSAMNPSVRADGGISTVQRSDQGPSPEDAGPGTASDPSEVPSDADTYCGAFGVPTRLLGLQLSGDLFGPTFGPNPLQMTFAHYASTESILTATRVARDSNFTPGAVAPGLESDDDDGTPFIANDGLSIFFYSTRPGGVGARDIWQASRPTVSSAWQNVRRVQNINSTSIDHLPSLPGDKLEIFFSSERSGGSGGIDLWRATRQADGQDFGQVEPVAELNTASKEFGPHLSADGLTLYFASDRPGGEGNVDVWVSRRPSRGERFAAPALVEGVNSTADDIDFSLTPDGREAFFSSDRDGSPQLWRAERVCP